MGRGSVSAWSAIVAVLFVLATPLSPQASDRTFQAIARFEGVTGDRWAVIIGINEYADDNARDLKWAVADARAVYEFLTDPERGAFPAEHVRLLVDDAAQDYDRPTRVNILKAVQTAAQSCEGGDTMLIYFAGHGGIEEQGISYLMPCDAQLSLLRDTGIAVERFRELIGGSRARRQVLIFDACHAGGAPVDRAATPTTADFQRLVFGEAEGRVTLAASQQGQSSYDWDEKRHGVFTYFLLEALGGAADANRDGFITVSETNQYVTAQVKTWAFKHNKHQTPRLLASVSGEIVLALARRPPAQPPAQAGSQSPSAATVQRTDTARAMAHNKRGLQLYGKGDLEGAMREYNQALRIDPGNAVVHYNLALVLWEKGDLLGAVTEWYVAARNDPTGAGPHFLLAAENYMLGDLNAAIGELRKGIALDPRNTIAKRYLAEALLEKGEVDEAIREYKEVTKMRPRDPDCHYGLARAYERRRRKRDAIAEFERALELGLAGDQARSAREALHRLKRR